MQNKYYINRPISDYDQLYTEWLAEEPVAPASDSDFICPINVKDCTECLGAAPCCGVYDTPAWTAYAEAHNEWLLRQPLIEEETIKPSGRFFIDICRGQAPVRLLFRQQFKKKFPTAPIADLLKSQKTRHVHWGPHEHALCINIYDEADLMGMKTLEVNLWENVDVMGTLEAMAEAVRTGRQIRRMYRLLDYTQTI